MSEIIGDCQIFLADFRDVICGIPSADHVITDPPYEKEAHTAMRRTASSIKSGVNDVIDFNAITPEIRAAVANFCAKNVSGWALAFCQVEAAKDWSEEMLAAGAKYKRTMCWVKPDSSPQFNGQGPAQGYECISASWCGHGAAKWNAGGKRGVYTHNCNSGRFGGHPTEKPLDLMLELISDFTSGGDLVVDLFMGSGTTGVACANLGRRFIGIERDEKYYKIAKQRIEAAYAQGRLFA